MIKKILKDYVLNYEYGYDIFFDDPLFGKFDYIDKTDIIKVSGTNS